MRLRARASALSRRSAKAVCLSDPVLGARRGEATSESQPPDYFLFPPSLPSHIAIHPSPAFACAAMAEPSAATQSPSVSSSSSVAESSAPGGGGGSPGACPALGAKSCGSSCAGEARRGTPTSGGGGAFGVRDCRSLLRTGGFSPREGASGKWGKGEGSVRSCRR